MGKFIGGFFVGFIFATFIAAKVDEEAKKKSDNQ